jgi:hypothetical protein
MNYVFFFKDRENRFSILQRQRRIFIEFVGRGMLGGLMLGGEMLRC